VVTRLASAALDEAKLNDIRGGYDISSGVTVNFAFEQATYVNHNLAQNAVIPTLTISHGVSFPSRLATTDRRCRHQLQHDRGKRHRPDPG
jgi:hypothetical protein